jgi:hypothetical protein
LEKPSVDFIVESRIGKFLKRYFYLLKESLKIQEMKGDSYEYSYYTYGQTNDRRNPNWKPLGILEGCCKKAGPNALAIKKSLKNRWAGRSFANVRSLVTPRKSRERDYRLHLE